MIKTLEVIREQESPRPSSKLSNSKADVLQAVSEQRRIDTGKLSRILARDLDWVVMKAIEKEHARRYESASGLGADIERYLTGESVMARPLSIAYRCRKFLRKHVVSVIVTSLIGLLIGSISFGALMQSLWGVAVTAQMKAEEEQKKADQTRLAFERLAAAMLPAQDDWPMIAPAELVMKLELVGSCRMDLQQFLAAEELFSKALEIRQREMPEAWATFQTRSLLGEALFRQDKFADAEQHLVAGYEGLVTREDVIPSNFGSPITDAIDRLIALYERMKKPAEVERYRELRRN